MKDSENLAHFSSKLEDVIITLDWYGATLPEGATQDLVDYSLTKLKAVRGKLEAEIKTLKKFGE